MSSTASAVILLGLDEASPTGGIMRKPFRTLYAIVGGSAPIIADEEATLNEDWGFPHSMVLGADPVDVAHEVAYFALARLSCQDDVTLGKAKSLPGFEAWPVDPSEADGAESRRELHADVASAAAKAGLRLQVIRFDEQLLGAATVKELEALGVAVEVYERG